MKFIKAIVVTSSTAFSFVLTLSVTTAPAQAQATRTWVSGVGDDANPCSRTAPCKTFAGAISKTATNGEINCLDPGGFGSVTITKGLSIVCNYTEGGILAAGAGVNGIVINAPATAHVYLRGLDIYGAGTAQNGVRLIAGASLTIEDSIIRGFNASSGRGVSFQPGAGSALTIINSTIDNNGTGATGGGILVQPTGAGGNAKVTLQDVRVTNNANDGLRIDSTGNTNASGITVGIEHSQFNGNVNGVTGINAGGTNPVAIMITGSTLNNNSGAGLIGNGSSMLIRVGDSTITGNVLGVTSFGGATINTYGNNRLIGNPTNGAANNGAFTGAAIPTQ